LFKCFETLNTNANLGTLIYINIKLGDGVDEWTKASDVTHTGTGSNLGLRAAFFFEQVTVAGDKCRHPPPGHGRYPWVPTKKSAKPKHMRLLTYSFSPIDKNKQLMAIVAGLHDQ